MSIRNSLAVMLLLVAPSLFAAECSDEEWERFKEGHDLYLLIKNTNKNEDRWVKFPLTTLADDSRQVAWIEREDLLPKEKKLDSKYLQIPEIQCHLHESRVGGVNDDQVTLLTIGISQPKEIIYQFVMQSYYQCVGAFMVPNKNWEVKPFGQQTAKEKLKTAKQYFASFGSSIKNAWYRLTGKKS